MGRRGLVARQYASCVTPPVRALRAALLAVLLAVLLPTLAACTLVQPTSRPSGTVSASAKPRDFTVLTAERITTTDPAAITTDVGAIVALNLFQRLMLIQPGSGQLRPDLASECLYTSPTVYECHLPKELTFSNGHELTSSDVKFSILRALRLRVPGTSLSLLSSLDRIETPNPQTVRFRLLWPDTQFGWGLAAPGASVVDEESYDPDRVRPTQEMAYGSGPYQLEVLDERGMTIAKFPHYVGPDRTDMPRIRVEYADSATAEKAIADDAADLIWRTLDQPAVDRLSAEMEEGDNGLTKSGFRRWDLPGTRIRRLVWNPDSPLRSQAQLRQAIALSLQRDRTLDSIVPVKVEGHQASFEVGGKPRVRQLARRVLLGLGYSSTSPDLADLAHTIRDRLEGALGVSVQLTPDDTSADLWLTERSAWINTSLGWLQDYLDNPLPGSADKLAQLEKLARTTEQADVRDIALGELQKQAAADATVLPISQNAQVLYTHQRVDLVGEAFGPCWQLGLWGVRWRS